MSLRILQDVMTALLPRFFGSASIIFRTERALTKLEGSKERPCFIHEVHAPGFNTGYSVKTLPSVQEAIERRQWEEADRQMIVVWRVREDGGSRLVANTLEAYSREIREAMSILRSA